MSEFEIDEDMILSYFSQIFKTLNAMGCICSDFDRVNASELTVYGISVAIFEYIQKKDRAKTLLSEKKYSELHTFSCELESFLKGIKIILWTTYLEADKETAKQVILVIIEMLKSALCYSEMLVNELKQFYEPF